MATKFVSQRHKRDSFALLQRNIKTPWDLSYVRESTESEGKRGDSSWKGLKFLSRKEQQWLNTAAQLWNFPLPSAWKFSPTCIGITLFIRWMNAIVFFKTVFWFLAKNVFMSIEPSIVKKKKKVIIIRSCFKKN